MTLDEWKAIQNKDRAKVEFNIRKPNEGADGQWKKGFVLHKSKSEEVGYSLECLILFYLCYNSRCPDCICILCIKLQCWIYCKMCCLLFILKYKFLGLAVSEGSSKTHIASSKSSAKFLV